MVEALKVRVENDVYVGTFDAEEVKVSEVNGERIVEAYEEDGEFTAHRAKHVKSIELAEE